MGTSGGSLLVAAFAVAVAAVTLWFNVLEPRRAKRQAAVSVRWEKLYRVRPRSIPARSEPHFEDERYERLIVTNHGPACAEQVSVEAKARSPWPTDTNNINKVHFEAAVLPFPEVQPGQEIHLPIRSIGCDRGMQVEIRWTDKRSVPQSAIFVLAPHVVF